ncbi:MAG: Membrane lipoprotein TmpC precursor [Firmicutes bacterium ADurb.Bin456]|nr:MAG: Membrane lipoprotein TmpC precursor [Firmicutes bacterium ADurb.Bin456]
MAALLTVVVSGCSGIFDSSASRKQVTEPLKVGLVLDVGGRGDLSFNDAARKGLEKVKKEFGPYVQVQCLEPVEEADREKLLSSLAREKYDLVLGLGQFFTSATEKVALDFPLTRFVLIDAYIDGLKLNNNISCFTFRENEGAFLAGAAAAMKTRSGKIGFIGGTEMPVIERFEAGYAAGAKYIKPDIVVLSSYVGTGLEGFRKPEKGAELALRQMDGGADVIFHAAGGSGNGVNEIVTSRGRLVIGVDIDQTFTLAEGQQAYVLTSVIKGVDKAVYDSVDFHVKGELNGGYYEYGLRDGGVSYAENNVNKILLGDIKPRLEEIKSGIVNGEIIVPVSKKGLQG